MRSMQKSNKPPVTGALIKVKCPVGNKLSPFYWCADTLPYSNSTTVGVDFPCRYCGGTGVLEVETFAEGEHIPENRNYKDWAWDNARPDWKALSHWPKIGPGKDRYK